MTEIPESPTNSCNTEQLSARTSSRDALLTAAGVLFTEHGYDGVSTREIAEHAGVNLALIQYHFGSKAKLFLETIDHLTDSSSNLHSRLRAVPETASAAEGAIELTFFIRDFLTFLLQSQEAHSSCRLIYRELFSGNTKPCSSKDMELFDSVIKFITDRHIKPIEERVTQIISFIVTQTNEDTLRALVRSVLGQCLFYATHRPIIAKLEAKPLESDETCNRLSSSIAKFSLRGLGCDEKIIRSSLVEVFGESIL